MVLNESAWVMKLRRMVVLEASGLLAFLLLFSGCLSRTPSKGLSVGPSGGSISAADDQVRLVFPESALATETEITVEEASVYPSDEGFVPGTAFDFGPDGLQFAEPVELAIGYEPSKLPSRVEEDTLRLAKVVGGQWEEVAGSTVDTAARIVEGNISSFSTYGVVGTPGTDDQESVSLRPDHATVAPNGYVAMELNLPATMAGYDDIVCHWHTDGAYGKLYDYGGHGVELFVTDLYRPGSLSDDESAFYDLEAAVRYCREGVGVWDPSHPEKEAYFADTDAKEGQTETVEVIVYGVNPDGSYDLVDQGQATINISGTTIGFIPQPLYHDWQRQVGRREYFYVKPGEKVSISVTTLNSPAGEKTFHWETTCEHGYLGLTPAPIPAYTDDQGNPEPSFWTDENAFWYHADPDGLDGEGDEIKVSMYLVDGDEKELLDEATAAVSIYAPIQWYSIWVMQPEGTGNTMGQFDFYHVGHGRIAGGMYARPGDKIEMHIHDRGEVGDIAARHGDIWLVPGPLPPVGKPMELPKDKQLLLPENTYPSKGTDGIIAKYTFIIDIGGG